MNMKSLIFHFSSKLKSKIFSIISFEIGNKTYIYIYILVYFSDVVECTPYYKSMRQKNCEYPFHMTMICFLKILLSSVQNVLFSNDKFMII